MITLTREEAQQVLDALEGSIDAQEWEINDHITKYGEWYRPKRIEYMKQQLANTNSTIETLRARLAQTEAAEIEKAMLDVWQDVGDPRFPHIKAQTKHWSDCAVHSEPAYPAGECDCGLVPVAWADKHDIEREGHDFYVNRQQPAKDGVPLYTAPPQREEGCAECGKKSSDGWALYCVKCSEREWQGLTDEEVEKIVYNIKSETMGVVTTEYLARAIEAKLKEKNT